MPVKQWNVGDVLTAADMNAWTVPQIAMKTLDQSVTSSTVLVNDTVLVLPVVASAQYVFECYLNFEGLNSTSAGGLLWQWTVPAAATMRYAHFASDVAIAVSQAAWIASVTNGAVAGTNLIATSTGPGNLCAVLMRGSLITGANAGNLQLQWAQGGSSATATIVHGQSYVKLDRAG